MSFRRRHPARPRDRDRDLSRCRTCASDSVVPTDWAEQGEAHWWIRLRCGACSATREVVVSDAVAQRYDLDLGRGMNEIAAALRPLERERITAEVETFVTALRRDLLDATDFAR